MKRTNRKKGAEVVESLIIIAILGSLAITMLYALNNQIIKKANATDIAVINSNSTDVDTVITNLNTK